VGGHDAETLKMRMPINLSQSFYAISVAALLLISGCALSHNRSPYADPDRLVSVVRVTPLGEGPILTQDFLALLSESKTLETVAGYRFRSGVLSDVSEPERIQFASVSQAFFPMLGIKPGLGRVLFPNENQPRRNNVAVISHRLWQRRYSGDPNLIGKAITLDQELLTVVGVMASDFQLPKECDVWTPLIIDAESLQPGSKSPLLETITRLKPGVTLDQAQVDVSLIASKPEGDQPQNNPGRYLKLTALRESLSEELKLLKIKIDRLENPPVETGKEK
jgi:putative ABC transport system permease protein